LLAHKAPGHDRELFRVAFEEAFWNELVPAPAPADDDAPLAGEPLDVSRLAREGVAPLGPIANDAAIAFVHSLFRELRHRGWPLVFAALHARFWDLFSAPAFHAALAPVLGDDFRLAPRLWPTHVAPIAGAGGWPPHLDAVRAPRFTSDGRPERLTVWLALTDATPDNGCMYIVPRDVAGAFPDELFSARELDVTRVTRLLHAARALPCRAGSAYVWTKDVIHWGGKASGDALAPRVSLATEVVRADAHQPLAEGPTIALGAPPSFEERVHLVGRQLRKYVAYESEAPMLTPLQPLADEMLHA
jgi:hypothetical protein